MLKRLRLKLKTLVPKSSVLVNVNNLIGRKVEKVMATIIEKWLVAALGSWKTTVVGGLAMVALLVSEGLKLVDGDPESIANFEAVIVAVSVFFGLSLAKDGNE